MASNPSKRLSSSITLHYDLSSSFLAAGLLPIAPPKKLRRMPHLFCRLLELPLHSHAPVEIEESPDRFTFSTSSLPGLVPRHVRADIVHILPGVTKIAIVGAEKFVAILDELDLLPWRFRLPACSLPEAATAAYDDDVLIVTVPKVCASRLEGFPSDGNSLDSERDYHSAEADGRTDVDKTSVFGASVGEDGSTVSMRSSGAGAVSTEREDSSIDFRSKDSGDGVEDEDGNVDSVTRKDRDAGLALSYVQNESRLPHLGSTGDEEECSTRVFVQ